MTTSLRSCYVGHRFPPEVISHMVWLYFRLPAQPAHGRGDAGSARQWARKFGQAFANEIRQRLPGARDKWHLDEVVITIAGKKHWLWRAVDQEGIVLDVLVQSRRDRKTA